MAEKAGAVLSRRALNRALLARQMLLERGKAKPLDVIELLCGMQAQIPRPPFIGLWSRISKFNPADVLALARAKKVVRATAMRGTIHLLSVKDFFHFRPHLAEMLAKGAHAVVGKKLGGADVQPFYRMGREWFAKNAAPFEAFREFVETRYPKMDTRAIAYTVRMGIPLVMAPTDKDRWGWPGNADFTLAEAFLGRKMPEPPSLDDMILRYIEAYGPVTPGDAQTWSSIRNLKPVFERLRPRLVTFRDERKRELFDVPKGLRPDEDTPAPVRFLGEYDNVALSHDDRSRIIDNEHRKRLVTPNLIVMGGFTVDGFISGSWRVESKKKSDAVMTLTPFIKLSKQAVAEVVTEAEALFAFVEPDARRTVRLVK